METNTTEWQQIVERVGQTDFLLLGRTARAFVTHPHTLQETEKIINLVSSHLLQQTVDVGGGSRGFSRGAADFVLKHSELTWWGDASWPILLQRAGFAITYHEVDGLDWETADRHQAAAADAETQRQRAAQIDADAGRWAMRVRVAQEIIAEGLAAYDLPLS